VTIEHEKSLPTLRATPEQFAPVAVPQVHELHVRPSLAPVYQYEALVFGGQAWAPSNIAHRACVAVGTQTSPPHPLPTVEAAQNRTVLLQPTGPRVGVPDGTHPPPSDRVNWLSCTP
jgi:hypothetical protein